jgi:hypothetical protein
VAVPAGHALQLGWRSRPALKLLGGQRCAAWLLALKKSGCVHYEVQSEAVSSSSSSSSSSSEHMRKCVMQALL